MGKQLSMFSLSGSEERQELVVNYRNLSTPKLSLSVKDQSELRAGVRRVWELMRDGGWHEADDIEMAAGENGVPAREGLRRMRQLREYGFRIDRRKADGSSRNFEYRICG